MVSKQPNWQFHTHILDRALDEFENCLTCSEQDKSFYKTEGPLILKEAREALRALKNTLKPDIMKPEVPFSRIA